jgi:hypothetical protein
VGRFELAQDRVHWRCCYEHGNKLSGSKIVVNWPAEYLSSFQEITSPCYKFVYCSGVCPLFAKGPFFLMNSF